MKKNTQIEFTVGKYLVVRLSGDTQKYIAEIVAAEPLRLKIAENGPLSSLRDGDFIVLEIDTIEFQEDHREERCDWLQNQCQIGRPPVSGLASFGVSDTSGKLYEILPGEAARSVVSDFRDFRQPTEVEPIALKAGDPHSYDLSCPDEIARLIREVKGYLTVSLKDGTDRKGRQLALEALTRLAELKNQSELWANAARFFSTKGGVQPETSNRKEG